MSRATRLAGITGALGTVDRIHYTAVTVTPAGSNSQTNSTPITNTITFVATLSAVTTRGVVLPNYPPAGLEITIINTQTTNMKVYPGTSAKLGKNATANSNVSLAALKSKTWIAQNALQWILKDQLA